MMYSILILLIVLSWLTVLISEKRNIFIQWLQPWQRRTKEFFWGLIVAILLCFLSKLFLSQLSGTAWIVSDQISVKKITFSFLYDLNSVLSEELLFRGVILYFLMKYLTPGKGVLISAISFGIYHWFSFGVFGNLMAMSLVFVITGLMGYVFAIAYEKTKSIVLPIGIHLGWNWVNNTVYSNGPNGIQILEPNKIKPLEGFYIVISFCLFICIALLLLVFVKSKIIEESKQINVATGVSHK